MWTKTVFNVFNAGYGRETSRRSYLIVPGCHMTCHICLWHFMWNDSTAMVSEASIVIVSEAYRRTDIMRL